MALSDEVSNGEKKANEHFKNIYPDYQISVEGSMLKNMIVRIEELEERVTVLEFGL